MNLPTLKYLPFAGILFLLLGVIFAIIASITTSNFGIPLPPTIKITNNITYGSKFGILAHSFILAGGFMLMGPSNKSM